VPQNNKIKIRRGLNAAIPSGGTDAGELRYSTDTQELFIDDGAANVKVGGNPLGFPVSTAQATADGLRVLKAGDTMTGGLSAPKIGVGTAASSLSGNKLTVGTGLGSFVTGAVAHFVDNSTQATVNYQNTNAAGFTAFDLFAHTGIKTATFAWSNASAAYLPGALWFMTRVTADMVLGTNTTERLRITAAGAVQVATSLAIGAGTALTKAVVYTPSLTPASVSAGAGVEQTFAVSGLTTGDTVSVNAPAGAVFSARVTAANTLGIVFMPPASGGYTPPAGTYRVLAIRS
jgi:hypothetical protein